MPVIIGSAPLVLTQQQPIRSFTAVALAPLTESLALTIKRPAAVNPGVTWPANATIEIRVIITVDGVAHPCVGRSRGGVRLGWGGAELTTYRLTYSPTWGFFGATSGNPKRLGETATTSYQISLAIELLSGSGVTSEIGLASTEAAAPAVTFHRSIAFDTATSAQDITGDGVISVTHTATGSDLAAFAGAGNIDGGGGALSSTTYAGTAMTELWDNVAAGLACSGYSRAGIASGASTVTNTVSAGTPSEHAVGVITLTGVHQTTPVGTANSANGNSTTATVTVASIGADDLVVANLCSGWDHATPGANETERYEQFIASSITLAGTTQPGTAGGVMTMTRTAAGLTDEWMIGGVAFKSSGPPPPPIIRHDYRDYPKPKIREAVLEGRM